MLAMIAGEGDLPVILAQKLQSQSRPFITCELEGFVSGVPGEKHVFRLENLARYLDYLRHEGVDEIVMAGAVKRPDLDPSRIEAETMPLIAEISAAMAGGDDHAIRAFCDLFERHGFKVLGLSELAPDLLARAGVISQMQPDNTIDEDADLGAKTIADMGASDTGQACVIFSGQVIAREGPAGTAAMLQELAMSRKDDPSKQGILFKAAKPGQDMRADIPVIGPDTVEQAAAAKLAGIVVEAGEVMILHKEAVQSAIDASGMFLLVRGTN